MLTQKDIDLMNARSNFERSYYNPSQPRPTEFLPNQSTPNPTTPTPAQQVKVPTQPNIPSQPIGGNIGLQIATQLGVNMVYPWIDRGTRESSLVASDLIRGLMQKPPLTAAQKQWFRDNPGKPATPDNGFPPASFNPPNPGTPGSPGSPGSPSAPRTPGTPGTPGSPTIPNQPQNFRPPLPPPLPLTPPNPNRPNTNIPGSFNPSQPGSGTGLGNPGGSRSYNFPPSLAIVGFTITVNFQGQFWQVVSGGREYPEGPPYTATAVKSYVGVPIRIELRTVNFSQQGKFKYFDVEVWLIYKPTPFDPETQDKVGGFSSGLNFRFVDAQAFFQKVNAPVESIPTQPSSGGQQGNPQFVAPPMTAPPPTTSPSNPAQPKKEPPKTEPPRFPFMPPFPIGLPFGSPTNNPFTNPTQSPTGTPTPQPRRNPTPTGTPAPGIPSIPTISPTGWGSGTGTSGFQQTPKNDPLVRNPVDNQGNLRGGVNQELNDKKAPVEVPNQVTPQLCQHDPCIAELQRNSRENSNQMVDVSVPRFLFWNRLTGARFVPETVKVPANMAGFAMMMGNRTADIRSRFGRHELVQRLQGFMNALTTITVIHNAAMLSRSLAETLGDLATNAFQTFAPFFGVPDETAQAFDLNEVLGKQTDEFMKSLLGEDVWTGTKQNWLKANRIISTATNIVWTVRSMADSTQQIAEWTAENTGKIGNALKRFRVVGENAYSWMPERVNGQSAFRNRIQKFLDGQENLEDAASSLNSTISEVRNVREEFNELKEQRENFDKAVEDAVPNSRPDNDATKNAAQASNAASKSPTLNLTDREKGESAL